MTLVSPLGRVRWFEGAKIQNFHIEMTVSHGG